MGSISMVERITCLKCFFNRNVGKSRKIFRKDFLLLVKDLEEISISHYLRKVQLNLFNPLYYQLHREKLQKHVV